MRVADFARVALYLVLVVVVSLVRFPEIVEESSSIYAGGGITRNHSYLSG